MARTKLGLTLALLKPDLFLRPYAAQVNFQVPRNMGLGPLRAPHFKQWNNNIIGMVTGWGIDY